MSCGRCPHYVKHGHADKNNNIVFEDVCGLRVKKLEKEELEKAGNKKSPAEKRAGATRTTRRFTKTEACEKVPFPATFDYMQCEIYIETFKSALRKNGVMPTRDFQYSETLSGNNITDMELL